MEPGQIRVANHTLDVNFIAFNRQGLWADQKIQNNNSSLHDSQVVFNQKKWSGFTKTEDTLKRNHKVMMKQWTEQ
jgi:hypothetical protein